MMTPTMPDFWTLLNAPLVELIGWALLHFVWQGALVAALLAGALWVLNDHSARVRYVVAGATLAGLLVLPVGTGLFLAEPQSDPPSTAPSTVMTTEASSDIGGAATPADTAPPPSLESPWYAQAASWLRPLLPWMVLGWGLGVLVFSVRLAGGAWRVRRLRRTGTAVSDEWQVRLRRLADQLGLPPSISLRRSPAVDSPMVTGWWRPVVLVPTGLLTGLPPDQVEALLLHELAHIRRHDVLVGRLQAVVEVLLFFHPATWWISRQVRREREACCDDLAVQAGAERTTYARALTTLAERAVTESSSVWAPAAASGSLLARIRRLLDPSASSPKGMPRLSMAAAVLFLVGVPVGLAACVSQQSATEAEHTAQESPAPDDSSDRVEKRATVVVQDDSTERKITVRSEGPVVIDTLPRGLSALRGNEDQLDTLRSFSWEEGAFDADSLEQLIRSETPVDSLARAVAQRMSVDSLETDLARVFGDTIRADSLTSKFKGPFEDSTFVVEPDMDVDSLFHWSRHHADRLSRALERPFADSTLGVKEKEFEWDVDVDSLLREQEETADRLLRWRGETAKAFNRRLDSLREQTHQHADSLRRWMARLHERQEGPLPERLRERARRLREQAQRLEERAEEMDARRRDPRQDPPADSLSQP